MPFTLGPSQKPRWRSLRDCRQWAPLCSSCDQRGCCGRGVASTAPCYHLSAAPAGWSMTLLTGSCERPANSLVLWWWEKSIIIITTTTARLRIDNLIYLPTYQPTYMSTCPPTYLTTTYSSCLTGWWILQHTVLLLRHLIWNSCRQQNLSQTTERVVSCLQ